MTRMLKIAVAAGSALAAAGCGLGAGGAYLAPPSGATAIRVESLLEADRAFSARANEVGVAAAYRDFMADDAKLLGSSEAVIEGGESIVAFMASLPEDAEISWTPREAMVSDSGELGVTWGEYTLTVPGTVSGEGGAAVEESGRYLTVWRKDSEGRWRGVLDIGT